MNEAIDLEEQQYGGNFSSIGGFLKNENPIYWDMDKKDEPNEPPLYLPLD